MYINKYNKFIIEKKVDRKNIDIICNQYKIKNYNINPDGSIDVDGNVIRIYLLIERYQYKKSDAYQC